MSLKDPVIISVTGAQSGVGKTTLCSILLRKLNGFRAIKFTKTPLYATLVDDYSKLNQKGKDTALFLESGAQKVMWIQSPYHELGNLLNLALSRMADVGGIIIEGNSPVDFLNPHLIIFIVSPKGEIKPSAVKVSKKADIVIINSEDKSIDLSHIMSSGKKDTKIFWIDLSHKKGELNEFLCHVKKRINKKPH
jgi:molybdopterin-guanine dinucleotide biosynthesis protein